MSNALTNTVGYYNGARWPIQLVISKLNITLHLKPGEYVLDRDGRKINDPFFDAYQQLKKEISDEAVPLIIIPAVQPAATASAVHGNNPVRGTAKFKMGTDGVRRPEMPAAPSPSAVLAQENTPAGVNPVTPMSMDEARRLGLVRRVREVPENYGVDDNAGAPPRIMPTIKYSVDPSMLKKPKALPKELLLVEGKDISNPGARTQLVSQLAKGAMTEATPSSASAFLNQTTPTAPAGSALTAGPAMPRSVLRSRTPALPPVEQESPLEPEMTEAEETAAETGAATVDLPAPDLTELQQEQQEQAPAELLPPVDLKQPAKRDRFICAGCGVPFKFYSQLQKHAEAKHKTTYAAIMAAYPQG